MLSMRAASRRSTRSSRALADVVSPLSATV
jgi:hypothetical protein